MKTIRDILDKIDYIVGEREGVSLDLGYLKDEDYSLDQALKEIQELLVDDMQGKKKILPSEHGDNPLKNSSEDYCMGYNQAIDDYENNIKARLK